MDFTLTSDGSTDPFEFNPIDSERQENATIAVYGTFVGASVTCEVSFDEGTNWIPIKTDSGAVLEITDNELQNITVAPCLMRFTMSNSASTPVATNVTVTLKY